MKYVGLHKSMKLKYIPFCVLCFLLVACVPWKDKLKASGNYEVAINNAILDYLNTSKLNEEFKSFHIITILNENVIAVSINGDESVWQIGDIKVGDKRKYFPSKFKEVKGKLFYWSDSTVAVNHNIMDVMKNYKVLDTTKYQNNFIPDVNSRYSKGAVHYYFCKTDYMKYKKINSKISIGYYKAPNLNCN